MSGAYCVLDGGSMVVHLPRSWHAECNATACDLFVGPGLYERPRFEVLTDPEERDDVTCPDCLGIQQMTCDGGLDALDASIVQD